MTITIHLERPQLMVFCDTIAEAAAVLRELRGGRAVEQLEVLVETEPAEEPSPEPSAEPARRASPAPVVYTPPPKRRPLRAVPPPAPAPTPAAAQPERRFPIPARPAEPPLKRLLAERESTTAPERKPVIAAVILEAYSRNNSFPQPELAKKIYGDATADSMRKLKFMVGYLCSSGKLRRLGAGSYRVRDESAEAEAADA